MRVVLDANVLMPSILRELLLGAAAEGAFVPLWSARILEEWARASRRLPEGAEAVARAEIAQIRARWPEAEVMPPPDLAATLALPDTADTHVLAAAIAGGAQAICTRNRADFPARALARHGLLLREPDGLLVEAPHAGVAIGELVARGQARAGATASLRQFLKRAGLPRLAKAVTTAA